MVCLTHKAIAVIALTTLLVNANNSASATTVPEPGATAPEVSTGAAEAPTTPPAKICGNAAVLDGPAVQPPGSVRVEPGTNLNGATQANPPGTTFWLAPGTFTLGTGQYDQVIPKDNNVYIGAPGAVLDGQGVNLYAFTQKATGVKIEYLTVQNFLAYQDQAAVNHDSGSAWTIQYNTLRGMGKAAMNAGPNSVTRYNCLTENGQTGINGITGTADVTVDRNEISFTAVGPGAPAASCGCRGGVKLFGVQNVVISNNWIHDNASSGVWADTNAAGWLIEGNFISDNADEAIFFETSYNASIVNNTISRNALVKGAIFSARQDNFPIAAVYISEGGGDSRMAGGRYSTLEISGNNFDNNYGGVTLFEDANRFCNTSGNTAPGFCPEAGKGSVSTCVAGTINDPPYYRDCRWHTQNVLVQDNIFRIDKTALGCEGTRCGENSIFSNRGTTPAWSPYLGDTIQRAITFNQNNRFTNNTYIGDWNFDIFAQGQRVDWSTWRASPFNQDVGSTITRANVLDADTSTLERSSGNWVPWYSSIVSRSTLGSQTGSASLRVDIGGRFWGVTLDNYPYFAASPGPMTLSFWGMTRSEGSQGATMEVSWRKADGSVITTETVTLPQLTSTWQQASSAVTAPAGTVTAGFDLRSSSGIAGSTIFLDDFVLGSRDAGPGPPPPPPVGVIDADTSTLERSSGNWVPWYSSIVSRSTLGSHTGSASLRVDVGGRFWGVTLDNYPYFAASPGPMTLSFWGMTLSEGSQGATMEVSWRKADGSVITTETVTLPQLTSTWQQASSAVTAPAGTVTAGFDLRSSSGIAGSTIFLDDLVLAA